MNDLAKVKKTISEGQPRPNAEPYREGWVYATKGDKGYIVKEHEEKYTIFFPESETATYVDKKDTITFEQ